MTSIFPCFHIIKLRSFILADPRFQHQWPIFNVLLRSQRLILKFHYIKVVHPCWPKVSTSMANVQRSFETQRLILKFHYIKVVHPCWPKVSTSMANVQRSFETQRLILKFLDGFHANMCAFLTLAVTTCYFATARFAQCIKELIQIPVISETIYRLMCFCYLNMLAL
jgi:hypothetical protein